VIEFSQEGQSYEKTVVNIRNLLHADWMAVCHSVSMRLQVEDSADRHRQVTKTSTLIVLNGYQYGRQVHTMSTRHFSILLVKIDRGRRLKTTNSQSIP